MGQMYCSTFAYESNFCKGISRMGSKERFFLMTNATLWMNCTKTCIIVSDDFLLPFKLSCNSPEDLIPQYCHE